jgi:hypothetical protein
MNQNPAHTSQFAQHGPINEIKKHVSGGALGNAKIDRFDSEGQPTTDESADSTQTRCLQNHMKYPALRMCR